MVTTLIAVLASQPVLTSVLLFCLLIMLIGLWLMPAKKSECEKMREENARWSVVKRHENNWRV